MTTLNQRIIEILNDEFNGINMGENYTSKMKRVATLILKTIHENPSIKKGLELLKEKRVKDKWDRKVRKQIKKIKK